MPKKAAERHPKAGTSNKKIKKKIRSAESQSLCRESSVAEEHTRSNGSDEIDEAEHTHVYQEEGEGLGEGRALERLRESLTGRGRVEFVDTVEWLERSAECEPESAESAEDNRWEGVSENELQDTADDHQYSTEEEVNGDESATQTACMAPAKQCHTKWIERQ
jgi:hypothetical protein